MLRTPPLLYVDATRRALRIVGDDRVRWLQGQITADVALLPVGATVPAFQLDATGKILTELLVHVAEGALLAVTDASRFDALIASLDRRIVMDDVTLEALDDVVVGVLGTPTESLASLAATLGARRMPCDHDGPRGECWLVPRGAVDTLRAWADAHPTALVDPTTLEAIRAASKRPRLGVDFDACLPQETGQLTRTVSFTKGCYVGQEPVIMLEHRGKRPRSMMVLEADRPLPVGGAVTGPDGAPAGVVTTATTEAPYLGLARIKRAFAVVGTALQVTHEGVSLEARVTEDLELSALH